MADKKLVCPTVLRQWLNYEPETGFLYWRPRARAFFTSDGVWKMWNKRFAGKRAFGSIGSHGYYSGTINYVDVCAHRVVCAILDGMWPREMVDHINRDKLDNRPENLRMASPAENAANNVIGRGTSTHRGVSYYARYGKWKAQVMRNGVVHWLGYHKTEDAAARAVAKFKMEACGEFAPKEA